MIRLESRGIADLGVLADAPDGDRRLLSAKVEALMLRGNALADVGRGALLVPVAPHAARSVPQPH
jgi:hypothetical protein